MLENFLRIGQFAWYILEVIYGKAQKQGSRPYPHSGDTEDSTQHILSPDWVL